MKYLVIIASMGVLATFLDFIRYNKNKSWQLPANIVIYNQGDDFMNINQAIESLEETIEYSNPPKDSHVKLLGWLNELKLAEIVVK